MHAYKSRALKDSLLQPSPLRLIWSYILSLQGCLGRDGALQYHHGRYQHLHTAQNQELGSASGGDSP